MPVTFTVRDLMRAGGPLDGAETLAGEGELSRAVVWAVSLRPYAPAIPPMKGGELALAGTDLLGRQGITTASAIERLALLGAAGFVVMGDIDSEAVEAARRANLPLIKIADASALPLHEIEQRITRECALFQAGHELFDQDEPGAWISLLLSGEGSFEETLSMARREGYALAPRVSIVFFVPVDDTRSTDAEAAKLAALLSKQGPHVPARPYEDGVVAIRSAGSEDSIYLLSYDGWACGIGTERGGAQAAVSFAEARLAALVSARLHDGAIVRYSDMGADRALAIMHRDSRGDLAAFVQETLRPLLDHDAHHATHLLPTVESYALHAGRLRETAGEIYVHRNTLAYRLERASEILGRDLKDPHVLLGMALALRAKRLLDGN